MRKQLWLACVVCAIGVLPGLVVGAVAAWVYRFVMQGVFGTDPDLYFMRTLFRFEAPGAIVGWIMYVAFPAFICGGVAGAIAVKLTAVICKGARYEIAAFVTGGLYTGLVIMLVGLTLVVFGINWDNATDLARNVLVVIGLWVGLFMMLEALPSRITATE
jgi:hypothetical protein